MALDLFKSFTPQQRALMAVGALLDGHEAALVLGQDQKDGAILQEMVNELVGLPPELRMPYLGSVLRMTLLQLRESGL